MFLKDKENYESAESKVIPFWERLYNDLYSILPKDGDLGYDTIGWNSSYTGEAIPNEEILDLIERTSNLILGLKPKRVLDIGCGTGLILSRIAPSCEDYWGTDISEHAIDYLEGLKKSNSSLNHVKLFKKNADDFEGIKSDYFDIIILNSVVQYFPNMEYLRKVLNDAARILKKGGVIFVGDVRNYCLQKIYHGSVEVFKSEDKDNISKKVIRENIQLRVGQERELVIDPRFFISKKNEIASLKHVQIQLKGGRYSNELTKFRYDVLLHFNNELEVKPVTYWVDWKKEKLSLSEIRQYLIDNSPNLYVLKNINNDRLQEDLLTLNWLETGAEHSKVSDLNSYMKSQISFGIHIEDLKQIAEFTDYNIEISWCNAYRDGSYDVAFIKKGGPTFLPLIDFYNSKETKHHEQIYANNPFQEGRKVHQIMGDTTPKNLAILTVSQMERILNEWNDTMVEYPEAKSIQELFERQVEKTPHSKALACGAMAMSYAELNSRANQLAHYLRRCGVGSEVLVGIGMERSLEMIISILGILKAGGGYVPLDLSYPQERLQYMLEDSKASVLLTQSNVSARFVNYSGKIIEIDRNEELAKENVSNLNNEVVSLDNIAYVIYTSGSTGKPKGVAVKQVNLILSTQARCAYYPDITRFILISSIGFDSSVAGIFSTLLEGGELVLLELKEFDIEELAGLIRKNKASHILCTPSAYYALMEHGKSENIIGYIGNVIVAGEACPKGLVEAHFSAANHPRLYNEYGPTECTVWSTVHEITKKDSSVIKIGRPIANVKLYILDESLNPVPQGITGEMYIGGAGVTIGYIGNPDLTAERFIANPYATEAEVHQGMDRLYRTGDLGRYLENGEIEFIGRRDEQVKIRGYRIELGEIEATLSMQDIVLHVAVIVKGEDEHKRIIAYIVPREEVKEKGRISAYTKQLRNQLLNSVPEYMVPSFFVFIERLPLTVNGKLDRKALSVMDVEDITEKYIAPRDKIEEELCEIWKEVLKLDKVGITDNFFKIGGDSIISILLIMRAKRFGIDLKIRDIFSNPTISTLASLIRENNKLIGIGQKQVTGVFSLSPIQKHFLAQSLININSSHHAIFMESKDVIIESLFREVIEKLLNHHDMLRTKFNFDGTTWKQELLNNPNYSYVNENLSAIHEEILQEEIINRTKKVSNTLDIYAGKLLAIMFYECGNNRGQKIFIAVHSLVVDKTSCKILIEDIEYGYKKLLHGEELRFLSKTSSYKDWVQTLESKAINSNKVKDCNLNKITPSNENICSKKVLAEKLTIEETELLVELATVYKTEIMVVLLTSLVLATGDCYGRYNLAIDLEVDCRRNKPRGLDTSRTIGWFSNIFTVFLENNDKNDLERCIKETIETVHNIANCATNNGHKNAGGIPAGTKVDLMFRCLKDIAYSSEERIFSYESEDKMTNNNYSLIVSGFIERNALTLRMDYTTKEFIAQDIIRFFNIFVKKLREIIIYYSQNRIRGFASSAFDLIEFDQAIIDELSEIMNKK